MSRLLLPTVDWPALIEALTIYLPNKCKLHIALIQKVVVSRPSAKCVRGSIQGEQQHLIYTWC